MYFRQLEDKQQITAQHGVCDVNISQTVMKATKYFTKA